MTLELFFATGKEEPFFVKNLENIQGDERDVIFLSVTYAKNRDGVLRHNFGPINGENGWRRLNVITTRARQHMRVFSSMRGDEIDLTKTGSVGARLLREFLLYAERGQLDSLLVSQSAQTESPFEADVLRELSLRGLRLQPQVGVAGYRIDLGVMDDEVSGRFVCGIECDGAAYHSSATARDRDRLRQQVLEGRGWTLHRIWSTDWFKDRKGQVERVLSLVEASRAEVREEARRTEAEREAAQAVALEAAALEAEPGLVSGAPDSPLASGDGTAAVRGGLPLEAAPYTMARLNVLRTGLFNPQFHEIPVEELIPPIQAVVEAEAPLHFDDLATRLASAYGVGRVGSRIAQHVSYACARATKRGILRQRGSFIWGPLDSVTVRSRSGTGITGDRIAPEEYQAAALVVLEARGVLDRKALVAEIRSLFGFSRTGSQLEHAIQSALDGLLSAGVIGEGGSGIVLRRSVA
jgi:very-short-patch-repair endonuclease